MNSRLDNLRLSQKPHWLNKKIDLKSCAQMETLLKDLGLNTVCQQAQCPNISECFDKRHATFLILGKVCTRDCKFCAVEKGRPNELDLDEPQRVAEAALRLNLNYVVITSVTRDDLADGGAKIFAETILNVRHKLKNAKIEVLIPDFRGNQDSLKEVVDARPDIIGHNVETVPCLYKRVRQKADYRLSLSVLDLVKRSNNRIYSKSGMMLGLGEKPEEVLEVFEDLRRAKCDFLSLGQYLSPSSVHFPVKEYISLEKFDYYKQKALGYGFRHVESAPYVRSSYFARL